MNKNFKVLDEIFDLDEYIILENELIMKYGPIPKQFIAKMIDLCLDLSLLSEQHTIISKQHTQYLKKLNYLLYKYPDVFESVCRILASNNAELNFELAQPDLDLELINEYLLLQEHELLKLRKLYEVRDKTKKDKLVALQTMSKNSTNRKFVKGTGDNGLQKMIRDFL